MSDLFGYILESSLFMLVFAVIYFVFFRRSKFYLLNRIFLLGILLLSLLIPFFSFDITSESVPPIEIRSQLEEVSDGLFLNEKPIQTFEAPSNNLSEQIISESSTKEQISENSSAETDVLLIIYCSISLIILLYHGWMLVLIIQLKHASRIIKYEGSTLAISKVKVPFSFLTTVYVNEETFNSPDFSAILTHEKEHIHSLHSVDLLFLCVMKSIFWINPLIYAIEKFLQENHEFTTDCSVINGGYNLTQYSNLLLRQSYPDFFFSPVNSFANKSNKLIYKRLKMLRSADKSKKLLIKYALCLPMAVLVVIAFSCNNESNKELDKFKYEQNRKEQTLPKKFIADGKKDLIDQLLNFYEKWNEGYIYCDAEGNVVPAGTFVFNRDYSSVQDKFGDQPLPNSLKQMGYKNIGISMRIVLDNNGKMLGYRKLRLCLDDGWRNSFGKEFDECVAIFVDKYNKYSSQIFKFRPQDGSEIKGEYYYSVPVKMYFGNAVELQAQFRNSFLALDLENSAYKPDVLKYDGNAIKKFMNENVNYPKEAEATRVSGQVIVEFYVDEDGLLHSPTIKNGINPVFDKEALRVAKMMCEKDFYNDGEENSGKKNTLKKKNVPKLSLPITFGH